MKKFLASIVFFVESDETEQKDCLLSELEGLSFVDITDIYNDGEDWNVECDVYVDCDKEDDNAIHDILIDYLPDNTWDYHYIKGIDNDFYWQP